MPTGRRSPIGCVRRHWSASGLERREACAALAEGRVATAEGEKRAVGQLKRAVELFASLQLPLDAARAQLELALPDADAATGLPDPRPAVGSATGTASPKT